MTLHDVQRIILSELCGMLENFGVNAQAYFQHKTRWTISINGVQFATNMTFNQALSALSTMVSFQSILQSSQGE